VALRERAIRELVCVSIGRVCVDELVKYLQSKYSRAGCDCGLAGASNWCVYVCV